MRKDYYPLIKGQLLKYRVSDGRSTETHAYETLSVASQNRITTAKIRRTAEIPGRPARISEHEAIRDAKGVYFDDEQHLAFPIKNGRKWPAGAREFRIIRAAETIQVPAGTFAECLLVEYEVGGGIGGTGRMLYAPGVGLVSHLFRVEEGAPVDIALAEKRFA